MGMVDAVTCLRVSEPRDSETRRNRPYDNGIDTGLTEIKTMCISYRTVFVSCVVSLNPFALLVLFNEPPMTNKLMFHSMLA